MYKKSQESEEMVIKKILNIIAAPVIIYALIIYNCIILAL